MASQTNRVEFLKSIRQDLHGKLKPIQAQLNELNIGDEERSQIIDDFNTLDAILEALEDQHVRIVLMGKTNAGKSSLANSLLQADVYITDAIQGTAIKASGSINLDKWQIHDTPGIMNNLADDEEAKDNIRRSHVKILVIDDQPYEPELELFRWATKLMPGLPTVVFFNKFDKFQNQPRSDKERILEAVRSKMRPFVNNVETDIIFGSASLFDSSTDSYKRQPRPEDLMDWLYNQADYSSTLIKVLDPAKQALTNIESNVLQVRERVARRIVTEYASGNATSALIPFSSVTVFPVKLHNMNLAICEIMGVSQDRMQSAESISKVFWEGVWRAAKVEALWSLAGVALAPFTFGVSLAVTAIGTFQEWNESQKRVLVLGEALMQWIKSGYPNIGDGKAYLDQIRKKNRFRRFIAIFSYPKVKKDFWSSSAWYYLSKCTNVCYDKWFVISCRSTPGASCSSRPIEDSYTTSICPRQLHKTLATATIRSSPVRPSVTKTSKTIEINPEASAALPATS